MDLFFVLIFLKVTGEISLSWFAILLLGGFYAVIKSFVKGIIEGIEEASKL